MPTLSGGGSLGGPRSNSRILGSRNCTPCRWMDWGWGRFKNDTQVSKSRHGIGYTSLWGGIDDSVSGNNGVQRIVTCMV